MPGYPAFLAGVALVLGRSDAPLCCLRPDSTYVPVSLRRRSPQPWHHRQPAGVSRSPGCGSPPLPVLANYTAAVLSEVLAAFLTTAALLFFVLGLKRETTEFSFRGHLLRMTAATHSAHLPAEQSGISGRTRLATPVRNAPSKVAVAAVIRKKVAPERKFFP